MTPQEEHAILARIKPKVEPNSRLMSPLYDKVEHAIALIDCAYFATHHSTMSEDLADPMRAAMDDGLALLRQVMTSMHDMCAWAE